MMLGDNSSWSRDGRAWTRVDQTTPTAPDRGWDDSGRESWEVPESLVIGRAFSVYWPHFRPIWPAFRLGPDLVLPARPNVEAIRWIY
jgi:signal peptidase I